MAISKGKRAERDWVGLWNKLGMTWEYEPIMLPLSFGFYRPDFYFSDLKLFVEVTVGSSVTMNRKNRKHKDAQKLHPEYQFILLTKFDHAFVFKGEVSFDQSVVRQRVISNLSELVEAFRRGFPPQSLSTLDHMASDPKITELVINYAAGMKNNLGGYESADVHVSRTEKWDVSGMSVEEVDAFYEERYEAIQTDVGERVVEKYHGLNEGKI